MAGIPWHVPLQIRRVGFKLQRVLRPKVDHFKSTKAKKTSRTPNVAVPSIAQAYAPTIASSEHDIA